LEVASEEALEEVSPEAPSEAPALPAPAVSPAMALPELTGPFSVGMRNDEVKKLQEMLSSDKDIYPEGITSGYYGELTVKAVERFQCEHGIICEGSPGTTGYGLAGPKTREKMNEAYGRGVGGGAGTISGQTTDIERQKLIVQLKETIKALKLQMIALLTQMVELLMARVAR